jgi:hypothetical protein
MNTELRGQTGACVRLGARLVAAVTALAMALAPLPGSLGPAWAQGAGGPEPLLTDGGGIGAGADGTATPAEPAGAEEPTAASDSVEPESAVADEVSAEDADATPTLAAVEADEPDPGDAHADAEPTDLYDYAPREPQSMASGAFTERVPIAVPWFRGLEPKLALTYSSRNGLRAGGLYAGMLGVGRPAPSSTSMATGRWTLFGSKARQAGRNTRRWC